MRYESWEVVLMRSPKASSTQTVDHLKNRHLLTIVPDWRLSTWRLSLKQLPNIEHDSSGLSERDHANHIDHEGRATCQRLGVGMSGEYIIDK